MSFKIVPAVKEIKPKLCINCKYIIKNDDNRYSECSLFQQIHRQQQAKINFLITGVKEEQYYSCSIARAYNTMCGEQGKMYKKKYTKNIIKLEEKVEEKVTE